VWPALRVLFNEQYREKKSVQDFICSLGQHLGKTEREKQLGRRVSTEFTSTSPRLEWTLHLTGKKSREGQEQGGEDHISFVMFDLERLSEMPNISVFCVSDVLRFLEISGQGYLIPQDYQRWARNCDEYVIMGQGIERAILKFIPWSEIQRMPIIIYPFQVAYTLQTYERFRDNAMDMRLETYAEDVCKMVVDSAILLAGEKAGDAVLVEDLVELILSPGVRFWGIKTRSADIDIRRGCGEILFDRLVEKVGQLSIQRIKSRR
jgi:hypothetical protein